MKPLSLQGIWWLPETPDDTETGTLTFDQIEGAKLSVVGRLAPLKTGPIGGDDRRYVIYGFTTTGKPVTLLETFVVNSRFGFPGIATEDWRVRIIAIGAHFSSADELLFNRSWVRFDGIARWLAYNPFTEKRHFYPFYTELTVRKPPRMQLGAVPGAKLYTDSQINVGRDGDEGWTSTSEAMIGIDADEPQTLNWHFTAASKLRSLAELLYGRQLHLTKLKVELPAEPKAEGNLPYDEVEIYAKMIGGDDKLPPVNHIPMLTAPELLEAAPNALADWFAQYDTLSAALHLLSTVASDRRMFINVRFLLAAQAVETFHREAFPGTILPADEHAALVKSMTAAIPPDTIKAMRDKLMGTLEWTNEPSLRQRLRALIIFARDGRDGVMPAYDKRFIDAVVATRNHETHHGAQPPNLLAGADLHWAIRRLVALLTVLFLRRLGLPSEPIDIVISRHQEFRTLWTTKDAP
jgi:hypothetical protein